MPNAIAYDRRVNRWRVDIMLRGRKYYAGLYGSRLEAETAHKKARRDWFSFEKENDPDEERDYAACLSVANHPPITLTLYGGETFVIEPVTRVTYSQAFSKSGATDGSPLAPGQASSDVMGKRRVLLSLPRVRWLERPEI